MKAQAKAIHDEFYLRRRQEKLPTKERVPPYDTAKGYLKRAVYKFVLDHAAETDGYARLKALVQAERKAVGRAKPVSENPFFWAFSFVFFDDDDFSGPDRSKFSEQLLYAYKHKVSERFLIGFLYQIGGHARVVKQRSGGKMEGWEIAPKDEREIKHLSLGSS